MANEQNLIPIEQVNSRRTREEHSRDSRKGGQKSGKVRRKRKEMKKQVELLLSLPFNLKDKYGNELKRVLEDLGIDEENVDNQMAVIVALWRTALSNGRNQVSAVQELRDIIGDKNEEESNVQRIKIINDLPREENNESS